MLPGFRAFIARSTTDVALIRPAGRPDGVLRGV